MLDVECFTQLLYIQRITKDTSILQASLLIPSPSCLVYRGENLPPFYTLRSLQSYIIDLFSLAAFSYKANNFTPSFIARVERPILLVIMFSSTSMLLKKKKKKILSHPQHSLHPIIFSLLLAKIASLEKPPFRHRFYPRKGGGRFVRNWETRTRREHVEHVGK